MVGDILAYQQTTCQSMGWPDRPTPANGSAGRSTNRPTVASRRPSASTLLSCCRATRFFINQRQETDNPSGDKEGFSRPSSPERRPTSPGDARRRDHGPCTTVIWYVGMPRASFGAPLEALSTSPKQPDRPRRLRPRPVPQSVAKAPRWVRRSVPRASHSPGYPAMTSGGRL